MAKSAPFREYDAECRGIANILSRGELRSQLLNIAAELEILASENAAQSSYQPYGGDSWFWSER